jgi:hypothetical protein
VQVVICPVGLVSYPPEVIPVPVGDGARRYARHFVWVLCFHPLYDPLYQHGPRVEGRMPNPVSHVYAHQSESNTSGIMTAPCTYALPMVSLAAAP